MRWCMCVYVCGMWADLAASLFFYILYSIFYILYSIFYILYIYFKAIPVVMMATLLQTMGNAQPMDTSIPHTHTQISSQSRWTPEQSSETVQSHWSPYAFTGMHLQFHWATCAFTGMHPHTNPQSRCTPQPFSPIPGVLLYILQETARQSVCAPGACINPLENLLPRGLPLSCCFAMSEVRFVCFASDKLIYSRKFLVQINLIPHSLVIAC